jgi:hypothetical protein
MYNGLILGSTEANVQGKQVCVGCLYFGGKRSDLGRYDSENERRMRKARETCYVSCRQSR